MMKRGLLCLLAAGVLALSGCTNQNGFQDEAVMKIDGMEIMKSEYMVYLYTTTQSFVSLGGEDIWTTDFDGQTADQLLEERTINTLQSVVAAVKYAEENDIALTDAQKEEAKTTAEQFVAQTQEADLDKMGITIDKMIPFMEDSYLYSLVYQELAGEYEVDTTEMDAYYEENKAQLRQDFTLLDIDTILVADLETANEVVKKARAGENFQTLFEEYDVDETAKSSEDGSKMTLYQSQLKTSFGVETVPAVGDVTEPVEADGSYFVVLIENAQIPTEVEVKTMAEASYRSQKQTEYSDARFQELIGAQKVEKMEEAFSKLEKFH